MDVTNGKRPVVVEVLSTAYTSGEKKQARLYPGSEF